METESGLGEGRAVAWARRRWRSTPFRTFIAYPALLVAAETLVQRRPPAVDPRGLPLMAWGYWQYRWCGGYRRPRGGGGPGTDVPPDRLVTSGPYAIVRNPMYLGHLIFLTGLALALRSPRAALLAAGVGVWFHRRVLDDERQLHALFGEDYAAYTRRVSRWLPGLF